MITFSDWLMAVPVASDRDEQRALLDQLLKADPQAAAIPDDEVERFVTACSTLRRMALPALKPVLNRCGYRVTNLTTAKARQGIRWVLRRWRKRESRESLRLGLRQVCFGPFEGADAGLEFWTHERFLTAYQTPAIDLLWLAFVARELGIMSDAEAWVETIADKEAVWLYRFWSDVGRISMRRLLYPEAEAEQRPAAAALATEADLSDLADKERKTSALRHSVRRLEQDRKRLKEQSRRLTQEQKEELSQARGEVAAAERGLKELRTAQRSALAELERRFERERAAIEKQMSEARAAFALALKAQRVAPVLAGRSVRAIGAEGDLTALRAQVETLGAQLVTLPDPSALSVDARGGLATVEVQLRRLALGAIQIKCDGNWRRRAGRFGISNAAFEVLLGERSIYQEGRPVCCGPLTSPLMSEYAAIVMALNWVVRVRPAAGSRVLLWSDCKFLVEHICGKRPLDVPRGCTLLDRLLFRLLRRLKRMGYAVIIQWVPRAHVHAMDRLCAATYYGATWYHRWKKGEKVPTLPLGRFMGGLGGGTDA